MASPDFCSCSDMEDLAYEMAAWRQALHRQPELAFEEGQTAAFVARKLREWGYAVVEEVGGNGVARLAEGTLAERQGGAAGQQIHPAESASGGHPQACGRGQDTGHRAGSTVRVLRGLPPYAGDKEAQIACPLWWQLNNAASTTELDASECSNKTRSSDGSTSTSSAKLPRTSSP